MWISLNRSRTNRITPFHFGNETMQMKSAYEFWHGFEVLNLSFGSINRADFFFFFVRFTLPPLSLTYSPALPSLPFLWITTNCGLNEKKPRSFDFTRSRTHTRNFAWPFYLQIHYTLLCVCRLLCSVWRIFSFIFVSITVDFFFCRMNNHNQKIHVFLAQRNQFVADEYWITIFKHTKIYDTHTHSIHAIANVHKSKLTCSQISTHLSNSMEHALTCQTMEDP